ncbi:hypothetical protein NDU88_005020 [Pleurodeles waltl]|uniref:Uncharacterized protein n=1 Tax=Pleurodeles waltl TaxID=8319 RepID=A0AAV7UGT8_PLEWA|nr:hypothetical protein NDU88_005020 [Pleurodeles waltl]
MHGTRGRSKREKEVQAQAKGQLRTDQDSRDPKEEGAEVEAEIAPIAPGQAWPTEPSARDSTLRRLCKEDKDKGEARVPSSTPHLTGLSTADKKEDSLTLGEVEQGKVDGTGCPRALG